MTGASKILTVSYGTFSCTLEGFDDPFNTMKAIAEYFRDLAAGDRYFGAEPPVPDAAMLHQIAEREIHRRVEAKIQENGVILRAADSDLPAAPGPAPAPSVADTAVSDVASETVAARLQRIRAKHSAAAVAAVPLADVSDETADYVAADDYTEDQHAEALSVAPVETVAPKPAIPKIAIPDQIEDILDEAENDQVMIGLSDQFGNLPEAEDYQDEDYLAEEYQAGETLSDVLPEYAPVAEAVAESEPVAEVATVEAEADPIFETSDDDILANIGRALPKSDGDADRVADQDADLPEALAEDDADDFDDLNLAALMANEPQAAPVATATELPKVDSDFADSADFDAEAEDDLLEDLPAADPISLTDKDNQDAAAFTDDVADEGAPAAEAVVETPAEAPAVAPRARARVIRIRRADPSAQPVAEIVEAAPQASEKSALSDEAEAALQAELAALEAELGGDLGKEPAVIPAAMAAPVAAPSVEADILAVMGKPETAPEPRRSVDDAAEASAVNRLMDQAKSEMGDEDTRRRQSAIAHLKAAVAATEADRRVTGSTGPKPEERLEPYRNDLDRVVRPRRPVSSAAAQTATAPEMAAAPQPTPTPLVLVSAQRIDRAPEPAADAAWRPVMPVRPRRIAVASPQPAPAVEPALIVMQEPDQTDLDEDDILTPGETDNVFADATSFQDFADQLGASALPDLLEAAAVYCAEVLQRPEFSRPLVMRQLSALPGQSGTEREDYLRGFGTLLRQGRITRVKRGMFALTDRSPYLAEARKIAG